MLAVELAMDHMLALLVLMALVDLEFLPVVLAHFHMLVLLVLAPMVFPLHK